jgi:multiple sugar transport system ATP-binding protein
LTAVDGELTLQTGFGNFVLAPGVRARLLANPKLGVGSVKVTCGIRPEDVTTAPSANEKLGLASGTVDLVEPLGSDVYVNVVLGRDMLLARVNPENAPQEDEQVQVGLALGKIHFFDEESGNSLLPLR